MCAYWLLRIWGEKLAVFGSFLIGLLILVGSIAIFMTVYAMELRRELRAELQLACDGGSVVQAPMQFMKGSAVIGATRAVHVRVLVKTRGPKTVRQCTAGLLSVRRVDDRQVRLPEIYETIDLPWSNKGQKPLDIGADDKEYVDVLVTTMDRSDLVVCSNSVPFRLGDLFAKPGTYEVKIAVKSGETGKSVPYSFLVIWNGKWDEVRVSELAT